MGECPPDIDVTRHSRGSSVLNGRAVIISAVHDYRSKRRGSIQAIADALARRGLDVSFVSIRFSPLSLLKRDSRSFLWSKVNRREGQGSISCFLWATPFHPFATRTASGDRLTERLHDLYAAWPNGDLDAVIGDADTIVVESGLGIALVRRIRRLNPDCVLIYRASDALDTIGAHPHLAMLLDQYAEAFDHFCLLSPQMAEAFSPMRDRTFCVPQGIEPSHYENIGESPYPAGIHAVSVGSMLFDRGVFDVAAGAFPDWTFHVIGCGQTWNCAPNVVLYPEMKFLDTLPYLAHANVGVAAYRQAQHCRYLADSSMKLAQYAYLRLPAVCPNFAVGRYQHRFGYDPRNGDQIVSAFKAALADEFSTGEVTPMSWDELVMRILDPKAFSDTHIPDEMFEPDRPYGGAIQNGGVEPSFAGDPADGGDLRARC